MSEQLKHHVDIRSINGTKVALVFPPKRLYLTRFVVYR